MSRKVTEFFFILFVSCISCSIPDDENNSTVSGFTATEGIFIVNEGNFMTGNGSLSFYSKESVKIYNDLFISVNKRPLGDVPNSLGIFDDKIFIVVNNSGKIEVTESNSLKSLATITGIVSPRFILFINNKKAYVSSLYSTKLAIINPSDYTITGSINIRRTSEAMIRQEEKVFVSCWSGGDEIIVINTATDRILDSLKVAHEPESMVIDKYGRLWVLCSGSYTGEYFPELVLINTSTLKIEKRFQFGSKQLYPYCIRINPAGDTIYYIEKSIWRMPVTSSALPDIPFVNASGRRFYKIGTDPSDGRLYATNALDYQQRGYLLIISREGIVKDSVRTGIIPGFMLFKK